MLGHSAIYLLVRGFSLVAGFCTIGTLALAQPHSSAKATANEGSIPGPVNFQEFIQKVASNHPERSIDQTSVERTRAAERKSGRLIDPTIAIGRERQPFGSARRMDAGMDPMGKPENNSTDEAAWTLSVTQLFPWPGALRSETNAAEKQTEIAKLRLDAADALRVFEAKELFVDLTTKARLISNEQENLKETQRILDSARARFSQGIGIQADVLSAQNEKMLLAANIESLKAEFDNLASRGKQLMGLSSTAEVTFNLALAEFSSGSSGVGKRNSSIRNPGTDYTQRQIQSTTEAASADIAAERKRSLPEIMTLVMLMREDSGMKMFGAMVGIRVPIFSGGTREALSTEETIVRQKASQEISWHEQKKSLANAQTARRSMTLKKNLELLKKEIVPNAQQHLSSTLAEYAQGRGTINAVNESRRSLLKLQATQITLEQDITLADLSMERIQAGFVDGEIDVPISGMPLSGIGSEGMGTGMEMGRSSGMSRMQKNPRAPMNGPSKGTLPSPKRSPQTPSGGMNTPDAEASPSSGMGGMGM
ncbi:MAG: hypothetical protein RIR26_2743 [Pseudomonadota bacterium]|jgi:outer membrane protein TolC